MSDNECLAATLPVCSPTDPPRRKADTAKWKQQHKDKASTLPLNLISTSNQQKVINNHLTSCNNDVISVRTGHVYSGFKNYCPGNPGFLWVALENLGSSVLF